MSTDAQPDELPPGVALAWGLRENSRRGPRPALSLTRIVEAATEVADTEGLEALSMSRLARQLGFTTMAVYRYVRSKDELLTVLLDELVGPPPALPATGWREDLEVWARAMLATFRRHPWAAQVPISGMPMTPNQVAWMEACLAALAPTPLVMHERASVLLMVSGVVRNEASLEADLARARMFTGPHGDEQMRSFAQLLRRLTEGGSYPALTAMIDSGVWDVADPPDAEFDFALGRALDGIAALIDART